MQEALACYRYYLSLKVAVKRCVFSLLRKQADCLLQGRQTFIKLLEIAELYFGCFAKIQ